MAVHIAPPRLYNLLQEEGFELPPECGDMSLEIPVDGLMVLKYTEVLTGDRLVRFSRALQRLGDDELRRADGGR